MFIISGFFLFAISSANTCVGSSVPIKFSSKTNFMPSGSRSKKVTISFYINRRFYQDLPEKDIFLCSCAFRVIAARTVLTVCHSRRIPLSIIAFASSRLVFVKHVCPDRDGICRRRLLFLSATACAASCRRSHTATFAPHAAESARKLRA